MNKERKKIKRKAQEKESRRQIVNQVVERREVRR